MRVYFTAMTFGICFLNKYVIIVRAYSEAVFEDLYTFGKLEKNSYDNFLLVEKKKHPTL